VAHPQTTSCCQVVANQFPVLLNGNETKAIGKQVHIVQGRHRKGCFEFAWQIGFAVKRVIVMLVFGQIKLNPVNPNGMVGWGVRKQGILE